MNLSEKIPTSTIDAVQEFGVEVSWEIPAFSERTEHVPDIDSSFVFSKAATRCILAGFAYNRRVYIHGPHGSGKTSHIEQVAARLKWPCVRINLDGHITRSDLVGRDMVIVREGKQVTEFVPGMLVWALERPVALVFDEYDAGRPDVMFVIQRLLETNGKLTLLDQNRVITPHPAFRIFATANTAGQGDYTGHYVGTQSINQAQMDRWHMISELGYPRPEVEASILCKKVNSLDEASARQMVTFAGMCREAFQQGDLSLLLSLRTLITWAENLQYFDDIAGTASLTFGERCDRSERLFLGELFQRTFGVELYNENR